MLVPNSSLKNTSIETCFVGRLSVPFVFVQNTTLFCCGYFILFKVLNFGRNWSVNNWHLLWWSPSKAGGLGFNFGENHPFWSTTSCCGWEALKWREGEKRGKAKYGNGEHLLHCSHFVRPEKTLSLAGRHYHRASACSSSGVQTGPRKDKLEQGARQRPRPLRVESRKTRHKITVKGHPSKETKDREWILMTHEEGEDEETKDVTVTSS